MLYYSRPLLDRHFALWDEEWRCGRSLLYLHYLRYLNSCKVLLAAQSAAGVSQRLPVGSEMEMPLLY